MAKSLSVKILFSHWTLLLTKRIKYFVWFTVKIQLLTTINEDLYIETELAASPTTAKLQKSIKVTYILYFVCFSNLRLIISNFRHRHLFSKLRETKSKFQVSNPKLRVSSRNFEIVCRNFEKIHTQIIRDPNALP